MTASCVKAVGSIFTNVGICEFVTQTFPEKHLMCTFYSPSKFLRFVVIALTVLLVQSGASAQIDPPGRVARISYASGNLSLAVAGSEQWTDVAMNRPISVGDSLWVPGSGRAELHVGSSVIRLNENSSLTFLTLSDDSIQLKLTRGTMVVRLRTLTGKEVFEINTPNLAFSLQEVGEYRVTVNNDNTSNVMVRRGAAIAYGDRDSISIREAEQVLFSGTNLNHSAINRMQPYDAFDQWCNDRDRAEDTSVSARYVSREVIGYQQLDEYGTWETHANYGAIWLPRTTEIGWAPYRNGNWLWVAPWGWTWVDRAPWGFAPYHYGRWAHIGLRWAWVPGPYMHDVRPVYAPALVAFVGGSNGLSVSVSIGLGGTTGRGVAWFPLAPGEAYRPGYHTSPRYLESINRHSGTKIVIKNTTINNTTINNTTINNTTIYANQTVHNAVTAVPASTFVKGQFVGGVAKPLTRDQIVTSQVGAGVPTLAPSADSVFGTSRRVSNPDNVGDKYKNRAVVATFNPAPLPIVRDVGATLREDMDKDVKPGGKVDQIDPRGRTNATMTNPAVAASPILLHNNGRAEIRDRNGRISDRGNEMNSGVERNTNNENGVRRPLDAAITSITSPASPKPNETGVPLEQFRRPNVRSDDRDAESVNRRLDAQGRNGRLDDETVSTARKSNTEAVIRRPIENSQNATVPRVMPEQVVNGAAIEQIRRPAMRSDERDTELGSRQSNGQRNVQNNGNRGESRVEERTSAGFNLPRENTQSAPLQRAAERIIQAPREMNRPVNQEPIVQQVQRVERQVVSEPRREVPVVAPKPEQEKERRNKSDPRDKVER
jgi:hypothetical protein